MTDRRPQLVDALDRVEDHARSLGVLAAVGTGVMVDLLIVEVAYATIARIDTFREWINSPALGFGGSTALDLIKDGRTEEVLAAIDQIASGAFV